jgi:phage tail-like protein
MHLNVANEWPRFSLHGVEVSDEGAMRLSQQKGAFVEAGIFVAGPFEAGDALCAWHRLRVDAAPLPDGSHLQLFTLTADEDGAPYDPATVDPFGFPGWRAAPRDVLDVPIAHPPASRLWIGGLLRSDGQATPVIRQMRVDYDHAGYLAHLPAIYDGGDDQSGFLKALLSLHESALEEVERSIGRLPELFDPFAVPAEGYPSWLSWLASWLAFDLNEAWDEGETRHYLVDAFRQYGKRGTPEGLRRTVKTYAGVEAHIFEPGLRTHLWSLGETSTLGFTTMLAPTHLQGAVLDSTATVNKSHLIPGTRLGAAMFDDLAHSFCVQVYCAELTRPGALEDVRVVLDREKPAHTTYQLCAIDSAFRVGVQACVGIDTIVAGGPPPAQVGMQLGTASLRDGFQECNGVPKPARFEPCDSLQEV